MALAVMTIATSIAGLSVSGVTIKDLTGLPTAVDNRECPVLYPKPNGFVSGLSVVRESFGAAVTAHKTVEYTLTYAFLYRRVEAGRGLFDTFDDMVDKAFEVLDAIIANDVVSGAIDITPIGIVNVGPVADPAGELFHGCELQLRVMEFVNG